MNQTKRIVYTLIVMSTLCLFSCVKDRIYAPNQNMNNSPTNPLPPADTIIKLTINEFLASNNSVSVPGLSFFPDWIEIYNGGTTDINLAGYSITDDLNVKDKYVIPGGSSSTIIKSKSYLLIIADDSVALGPLHANFSLSKGGESIALYSPRRVGLDSVTYTAQQTDVSFGRLPNGTGNWQTQTTPTPTAANY